jgi:hypothetical protein
MGRGIDSSIISGEGRHIDDPTAFFDAITQKGDMGLV